MLKCTKFKIGRDSAPELTGGAYNGPQTQAEFKRPTSEGRMGKRRGGKR